MYYKMNPGAVIPKLPTPQTGEQYTLYIILAAALIAWMLWLTLGRKRKWKGEERREINEGTQCMIHTKDIEKLKVESTERNAELQEFKLEMIAFKHDVTSRFDEQRMWMEKKFDALNTTLIDILREKK